MHEIRGIEVVAGKASGPICRLDKPISFWGGVDPETGRVIDPRHPDVGRSISGSVLAIPSTIGSSSSSAIMLELLRHGTAPAGIILGTVDAILTLGIIVGEELGYRPIPVTRIDAEGFSALPVRGSVQVRGGIVTVLEGGD